MKVFSKDFTVSTSSRREVVNVTSQVENMVKESNLNEGIVLVCTQHTTTALLVNEDESGLRQDFLTAVKELFDRTGYQHDRIDRNAASHLAASFGGVSVTLPLRAGRLIRGTWQSILFFELDGPRQRTITVQIIGLSKKS